jgi:hypothetical protein
MEEKIKGGKPVNSTKDEMEGKEQNFPHVSRQ